ncbi:hypothetical protein EFR84_32860 [Rhizobium chutanense]|uniref:Uncharacterized protein n=1 Tax=Rhizobium chutanense TaxID=2035448 RepID=A0A3S0RYA1_9HYPH|nr:hypothetical protein EFR84_32860 [Rhizobium chutanense]
MHVNKPSGPGMPRIQKLANLGPVGVLSSCCTMRKDLMPPNFPRSFLAETTIQPLPLAAPAPAVRPVKRSGLPR